MVKPDGALYVAVPDASRLTDRIYRWLAKGGGHVNRFVSAQALAATLSSQTGLRHVTTRTLCTSFSFLNRRNWPAGSRAPRRILLFGNGREGPLRALTFLLRLADRCFGTRLAVYGWAFYFGNVGESVENSTATNVCARCGASSGSHWLVEAGPLIDGAGDVPIVRVWAGSRTTSRSTTSSSGLTETGRSREQSGRSRQAPAHGPQQASRTPSERRPEPPSPCRMGGR